LVSVAIFDELIVTLHENLNSDMLRINISLRNSTEVKF